MHIFVCLMKVLNIHLTRPTMHRYVYESLVVKLEILHSSALFQLGQYVLCTSDASFLTHVYGLGCCSIILQTYLQFYSLV